MNQKELYDYLQPIVSGCGGFIKSNGFMLIEHDQLILMSFDRAFMSIIKIRPLNLIYIAYIKDFINCKEDPEHFMENTHFMGNMMIFREMSERGSIYGNIENNTPMIYYEEDMINIDRFSDEIKTNDVSWIKFNDGISRYKIPVAKCITPINKGDYCSLRIFDLYGDNTRILNYIIHKKKLKLDIYIYTRQLILG